jgi:hypothetical protein
VHTNNVFRYIYVVINSTILKEVVLPDIIIAFRVAAATTARATMEMLRRPLLFATLPTKGSGSPRGEGRHRADKEAPAARPVGNPDPRVEGRTQGVTLPVGGVDFFARAFDFVSGAQLLLLPR